MVAAGQARGLVIRLGAVGVGFSNVTMDDVAVEPEGTGGVKVHARRVAVAWTVRGTGAITLEGVSVEAEGEAEQLREALAAWRLRHPSKPGAGGSERLIVARDVTALWKRATAVLKGHVAEVALSGSRLAIREASGSVPVADLATLDIEGASLEVDRALGTLVAASARRVGVRVHPRPEPPVASSAPAASPTPSASIGSAKTAPPKAAPPKAKPSAVAVSLEPPAPAVKKSSPMWGRLAGEKKRLDEALARLGHGVEVRIDELTFEVASGKLGPWTARAVLGADALLVEVQPAAKDGRKPLELRALVPRGAGKWSVELKAGPASLAEIGVSEGNFGFSSVATSSVVARGALEIDPELETFAANGTLQVASLSLQHPGLAEVPVSQIAASASGVLTSGGDFASWTLTGGRLELGKGRLDLEGTYERLADGAGRVRFSWAVPTSSCGDVFSSMPKGLLARLDGLELTGTFAMHGAVAFDARAPEKTDVDFVLDQRCKVGKAPAFASIARLASPFALRVYDAKGRPKMANFGPGTPTWTPFAKISPYVVDAVLTCEDGAFFGHQGFSAGAIRNAIIANLKAGKFLLGASTVSMQTAKNVFLDRKKQLGRKLEEAVLTVWLEQRLSKNEILELYLNVIEFGPELYGIGPAAMHWFGRTAGDLDPAEAMFLVSLLPRPVARHSMWDAGTPGDGYLGYVRSLLKEAHRRGKLDDEEFAAAVAAPLVFHRPGQPLPAPHGITAPKWDTSKSDDPWNPVTAPE